LTPAVAEAAVASEPEDLILPMLREWRSEIQALFSEMCEQLDGICARLDRMENDQQAIHKILVANRKISRRFSGDFEARFAAWFGKD
jgi:hypothetical protein